MTERSRVAELAKRRGFFFPANEVYGGTGGFYVYGPAGAQLKQRIEEDWRDRFLVRAGYMEIESPTVMPEAVFEASGHLEGFSDMIVECGACGATHRADQLVEAETGMADAEARTPEEIGVVISEEGIECPECGGALADEPVGSFNLMFATNIGPGDAAPGYLRPETAQGMFVEFPRLAEYARGKLPFGVGQVGPAYRNEISPRRGLVRLREFTQAELEVFVDPEVDEPPLDRVGGVEVVLLDAAAQVEDGSARRCTIREGVASGVIESPWVAYYLGVSREWYAAIGVDMERFRYRQHLGGERAHYAADCWDAEVEVDGDWIEVTGFAYRADYDLLRHQEYAGTEFTVFREYDEPVRVERTVVSPDMSYLGPEHGADAERVVAALEALADADPGAFEGDEVRVEVDGETVRVPVEATGFAREEETVAGEHLVPHVVEPSFGVDRLVYAVLAHSYRRDEVDGEERVVLGLPPGVAPTFVGVFPLMDRDGLGERAADLAGELRAAGYRVAYDDAGSIGRRYRRQDEVGTPYCVTVDYDTLEDGTVTVRDRDSARQRRVPVDNLVTVLGALRSGERAFQGIGSEVVDA